MAAGWAAAPMLALAVALAVLPSPVRGEVTRIEIVKRDVIPGPGFGAAGV